MKITNLTSTAYHLLSDRLLWWKEPILASCPFRGFQLTLEKPVENLEMDNSLKRFFLSKKVVR